MSGKSLCNGSDGIYSPQLVISLTHSQVPRKFSFQRVTFPSPQLTASMLPAKLHETRQTTSGNFPAAGAGDEGERDTEDGSRGVFTHCEVGVSFVQIKTVLSWSHIHEMKKEPLALLLRHLPEKRWQYSFWANQCWVPKRHHGPNQYVLLASLPRPTIASHPDSPIS